MFLLFSASPPLLPPPPPPLQLRRSLFSSAAPPCEHFCHGTPFKLCSPRTRLCVVPQTAAAAAANPVSDFVLLLKPPDRFHRSRRCSALSFSVGGGGTPCGAVSSARIVWRFGGRRTGYLLLPDPLRPGPDAFHAPPTVASSPRRSKTDFSFGGLSFSHSKLRFFAFFLRLFLLILELRLFSVSDSSLVFSDFSKSFSSSFRTLF